MHLYPWPHSGQKAHCQVRWVCGIVIQGFRLIWLIFLEWL